MKTVGIITTFRQPNFGSVLQAFALQYVIEGMGYNVKVIDYKYPNEYHWNDGVRHGRKKVTIRNYLGDIKRKALLLLHLRKLTKMEMLDLFIHEEMKCTPFYSSRKAIQKHPPVFDIYVSGSDQIWNEFFTLHGEGKVTTAYYLSFCPKSKKIAYAASFGFDSMNDEIQKIITPLLIEFNAISVRENSAKEILSKIGIQSEKVCDPTFLLNKEHYVSLSNFRVKDNFIAKYILRKQTSKNNNLIESIIDVMHCNKIIDIEMMTVENWLGAIKEAHYCITNSFHCTVFSIIFHTPFYVIAENGKGSGMNDRLITLLNDLQLTNRIINSPYDIKHLEDIDWAVVDNKLNEIVKASKSFIYKNCFLE